ncbi:MAG: hypothetical protein V2I66_18220, partial [Halieaceae bacterium]|nr:hypothetical protein [Halieaceae bacterium]
MLVVGEWLSRSQFDSRSSALQSFHVDSAGIPVGWLRQVNRSWQTAAFVMPLGYKASLANASWRWE